MGALFRLVSLVGVMSAGFYVLYLAQEKLTEPQSLTVTESQNGKAISLGPGTSDSKSDMTRTASKVDGSIPPVNAEDKTIANQWEPAPADSNSSTKYSKTTNKSPLTLVAEDHVPGASETDSLGIDFRETSDFEGPRSQVMTADAPAKESGEIRLVAADDPFAEDLSSTKENSPDDAQISQETVSQKSNTTESDPFTAEDPFGDLPKNNSKPVDKKESDPLTEFDPFGDDLGSSEATPKASPKNISPPEVNSFPGLDNDLQKAEENSKSSRSELNPEKQETENSTPDPFVADDPFGEIDKKEPPTGERQSNNKANPEFPVPTLEEDPFPGLMEEKSKPAELPAKKLSPPSVEDPFDSFPAPDSSPQPAKQPKENRVAPVPDDEPFTENDRENKELPKLDSDFPEFPGGLDAASEAVPPKTESDNADENKGSDPLGESFPPLDDFPANKSTKPERTSNGGAQPVDAFPSLEPLDNEKQNNIQEPDKGSQAFPTLEEPANEAEKKLSTSEETLPAIDQFPKLEEKLRDNSREIDLTPQPREEAPEESSEDESNHETPPTALPEVEETNKLPESSPAGNVPSLTDLQGDGVIKPDTPSEIQLPHLEITKQAPQAAVLNQPFVYTILVKNSGDVVANEVTVQDQIPKGSNLTGTIPQAELVGRRLVWSLGRIEPGQEEKIAVRIVPVEPGPLGSVATVNFVAEVGSETVVEHPQVTFDIDMPTDAKVGEIIECKFTLDNQGHDVVSGILLRDIIPEGLHHPAGRDLENPLGDLKPGQKMTETLHLKVLKPGRHVNEAVLTAEGGLTLRQRAVLDAAGNRLTVTRRGPRQRFVGRPAIFQNIVTNQSKEIVRDAVVIEKLPAGMQFEEADRGGQYHAASREIHWRIGKIAPGQSFQLQSRLTPTSPGNRESLVRVLETQGNEIQMVSHTQIRSYASIGLEMTEFDQPILTGDTVTMRIEATNRGNKSAQSVEIRAKIPPTLELLAVRGETRFRVEGREVVFETLNSLSGGETEIIELELKAAAAAPSEVAVSIKSQEMQRPLQKASALEVHARQ